MSQGCGGNQEMAPPSTPWTDWLILVVAFIFFACFIWVVGFIISPWLWKHFFKCLGLHHAWENWKGLRG